MSYQQDQPIQNSAVPEPANPTKMGFKANPENDGSSFDGVSARAKRFIKKQIDGDEKAAEEPTSQRGDKVEGEEDDELEEGGDQKVQKRQGGEGAEIDLDEADENVEGAKLRGDDKTAGLAGDAPIVKEDFGKKTGQ